MFEYPRNTPEGSHHRATHLRHHVQDLCDGRTGDLITPLEGIGRIQTGDDLNRDCASPEPAL